MEEVKEENNGVNENVRDESGSNNEEEDYEGNESLDYLLYGKRVKAFIKDIGREEEIEISFAEEGYKAIQDYYKLITAVFSYEIVEILKDKGRKRINQDIVKEATSNLLSNSDAMNITVNELQNIIEKLYSKNKVSNIQRATEYVNHMLIEDDLTDE
ncbi:hypothetical protein [Bacillus sp. FJAT-45350]|uniref:hypothetical protein n=1 Tax=Bacillus sp. FJAT-45350 TaxID=2011014 RepID=UPI000BB77722|nr:hypothetical protein [Bacillus sp. FJAT-45350]